MASVEAMPFSIRSDSIARTRASRYEGSSAWCPPPWSPLICASRGPGSGAGRRLGLLVLPPDLLLAVLLDRCLERAEGDGGAADAAGDHFLAHRVHDLLEA